MRRFTHLIVYHAIGALLGFIHLIVYHAILTFLGRRQLATDPFFSVAKWENVGDQLWNSGRQCKIFSRIGDQKSAISDPAIGALLGFIHLIVYHAIGALRGFIHLIVYQGFSSITVELKLMKPNVLAIVNRTHSPLPQRWLFTSDMKIRGRVIT